MSQQEDNKKVVLEWYELAFNRGNPTLAAERYFGEEYIQHTPRLADGVDAFIEFVELAKRRSPEMRGEFVRILADDALVAVHSRWTGITDKASVPVTSGFVGLAVVDIFRLEDGKIVEHWDVVQPIPEKSANDNPVV